MTAMYCPKCMTEYREGLQVCADCHMVLSPGPPPSRDPVNPATLITVLEIKDSLALTLAEAALEDAGIEYAVRGDDPRQNAASEFFRVAATPMGECHCWIVVAPECAEQARTLLEPLENPDPSGGLPEGSDPDQ